MAEMRGKGQTGMVWTVRTLSLIAGEFLAKTTSVSQAGIAHVRGKLVFVFLE